MATEISPLELYQSDQIRALEQIVYQQFATEEYELMQRAGRAAFLLLQENWPQAYHVTVLCGAGNNGGDGYVVARLAKQAGLDVHVYYLKEYQQLTGAALQAAQACAEAGVSMSAYVENMEFDADIIVDAILGTGLQRDVEGLFADAIYMTNESDIDVLSLDVPSGLNSDTGQVHGTAVVADATMTFIGNKQGLLTGGAPDYVGEVYCDDLDIPEQAFYDIEPHAESLQLDTLIELLPVRDANSHKGDFGHVLIVGGNYGMPGAAHLAAEAALRCGAGLVTVATRPEHVACISASRPEALCYGINQAQELKPLLDKATVVVIGPGLGQDAWAQSLLQMVLTTDTDKVIDADALNLLAQNPTTVSNAIFTPHPGEAARLLDRSVEAIQQDRFASIKSLQQRYQGVWILKGAGSLVLGDEPLIGICEAGNPGMASGGMGDVLSGILASLLAQNMELTDAAQLGTCIHASAGDLAAEDMDRGLIASDLMPYLRECVN